MTRSPTPPAPPTPPDLRAELLAWIDERLKECEAGTFGPWRAVGTKRTAAVKGPECAIYSQRRVSGD